MAQCKLVAIFEKHFLLAFIACYLSSVIGKISVIPKDTEAATGNSVTLQCRSSTSSIEWQHLPYGQNFHQMVYQAGFIFNGYKERFSINRKENNEYNLVIRNVSTTDPGRYTCIESSDEADQKTADLIVFEQFPSNKSCAAKFTCTPVCDALELTCSMKAHGNIIPVMEWRESGNGIVTSNSNFDNGIATSSIQLQPNSANARSYSCNVKYPTHSSLSSQFSWQYTVFDRTALSASEGKPPDQPHAITTIAILASLLAFVFGALTVVIPIIFFKIKRKRVKHVNSEDFMLKRKQGTRSSEDVERCILLQPAAITSTAFLLPSNVAVLSGNNVSLSCKPNSPSSPVTWYHIPVNTDAASPPINKGATSFRNFSEYSFGGIAPGEILSLNHTWLRHAGLYRCATEGQQATAQLIVLESTPNCSYDFDKSRLYVSCNVTYGGYWAPSMHWLKTNSNRTETTEWKVIGKNDCSTPSQTSGTIDLNLLTNKSILLLKLNFTNNSCLRPNTTAINVPSCEFTWNQSVTQINNISRNVLMPEVSSSSVQVTSTKNAPAANHLIPAIVVLAFVALLLPIVLVSIQFARMSKATRRNSRVLPSESESEMAPRHRDDHEDRENSFTASASKERGFDRTISYGLEAGAHCASVERSEVSHQYTGADGTVYLKLKGLDQDTQTPSALLSTDRHPGFNKSEYASIDHCLAPLPVPPR